MTVHLNHAGYGPLPAAARASVAAVAERLGSGEGVGELVEELAAAVRSRLARLCGVPAGSLAFTRSAAEGVSLLARGIDWRPGDNVVTVEREYGAVVLPWLALAGPGVEVRFVRLRDGRARPEQVMELVDGRTRAVCLSHVQFWNGYRCDVAAIGAECRRSGCLLAVDVAQSAGALRLDLAAWHVDLAVGAAYKWLLGPPGLGFCVVGDRLLARLTPLAVGVGSLAGGEHFAYDVALRPDARRFEESAVSPLDLAALLGGLDALTALGPDRVERAVLGLSARLGAGLRDRGLAVLPPWPRVEAESSGIVSFTAPGLDSRAVHRGLRQAGIVAGLHPGFVRLSPHGWSTAADVDRALDALSALVLASS